jgi:maltooligosyltrehalose trehalohydrolase
MPAWSLKRGATVLDNGSVRFDLWALHAREVRVRIGTGAAARTIPMTVNEAVPGGGGFTVEAQAEPGEDYVYLLDGDGKPLADPVSRLLPEGVHGPSRIVDPRAFRWTDDDWRGIPMADHVIYELHVGTFTPEGTFEAIIPRLAELRELGVTAIELMPVSQFPGERNWGYDGVNPYAVQNSYGGPEGLQRLVDAAHAHRLAVILDVVYNHLGPEGNYLDRFGPYFTEKYRTPWGRALNYDDVDCDEVRRYVIDNACHWVSEYHIDGLRVDAIHGIYDLGANHLLEELTAAVHHVGEAANRTVTVIAESDLNDPRVIRRPSEFGWGLDAQWSDDFHHAVHAALTAEHRGYYADFGSPSMIADAMIEPFVYHGQRSPHRRRRHGGSSEGLPRERFVVAIQNHDQVGNRAAGDRLSTLIDPAAYRLAASLLLLSPYVPLLFMGEEYGETNPFQYFVSHGDAALVEAVRAGRRREFESFHWVDAVPDPQDAATFEHSRVEWSRRTDPRHAPVLALYRDLLALRRDEPMMRPDGALIEVLRHDAARFWMHRTLAPYLQYSTGVTDTGFLAVFNCASDEITLPVPGSVTGAWSLRFSSDAAEYGGEGRVTPRIAEDIDQDPGTPRRLLVTPATGGRVVTLPAWTAALYERVNE